MKDQFPDICSFVSFHSAFLSLASTCASRCPSRSERLALFFAVLLDLPALHTQAEAKYAFDTALNVIEDRFSGVPYSPGTWMTDGRMYPANEDFRRRSNVDCVAVYYHRAHASYFGSNGAIRVSERRTAQPAILADRPGADGKYIGDLLEQDSSEFRGTGAV